MTSTNPDFDLSGLLSQLPALLQDIVHADFALQAVPLGRVNENGAPLPFLFATRIGARLAFQCFRSDENNLLFNTIKLSKRDEKLGDLRFKTTFIPGNQQSITSIEGIQLRLLKPVFINYRSIQEPVIVQSSFQDMFWKLSSINGNEAIRVKDNAKEVVLDKKSSKEGCKYITELIREFTTWSEAATDVLQIRLPDETPDTTNKSGLHFCDLLRAQKAIIDNIREYLRVLKYGHINGDNLPISLIGNQVLSGGYQLSALQTDILTSLNRKGMLVLKGVPEDAQQFDISARMDMSSGQDVVVKLLMPDILTQGAIWSSVCEGLIRKIKAFKDAMVGVYKERKNTYEFGGRLRDPRYRRESDRDEFLVKWLKKHFSKIGNESRVGKQIESWFQHCISVNKISIIRLKQDKKSDVNLIWLHGVPGDPQAEVLFIADMQLDNYPNVALQQVSNVFVAGILIPEVGYYFFESSKYWKHVWGFSCRLLLILSHWLRLTENAALEPETGHV